MLTIGPVPDAGFIWFLMCSSSVSREKKGRFSDRRQRRNVCDMIRPRFANLYAVRIMRRDFTEEIPNAGQSRSFYFFQIYLGQPLMHGSIGINIDRGGRLCKLWFEFLRSRSWYFYRSSNLTGEDLRKFPPRENKLADVPAARTGRELDKMRKIILRLIYLALRRRAAF